MRIARNCALIFTVFVFGIKAYSQRDTAKVGVYVLSLYDFDLTEKSYTVDFWLWLNHKMDSISFENTIEITNAKSTEFSMYLDEIKNGVHWVTEKCHAVVKAEWDISNFPFDKQVLSINVEEGDKDTTDLIYVADFANSKIDEDLKLKSWVIEGFSITDSCKVYNTSYGDPELADGYSAYSQVRANITLRRIHVWTIFFKIFTGVFVGFLISLFVFFIKPINVDPRFGLCVGGLFAAVGNKYVVESTVSSIAANTLIDTLHNLTFVSIMVVIVISIISLYIFELGGEKNAKRAKKVDLISFFTILVGYIFLAVYFVRHAMQA